VGTTDSQRKRQSRSQVELSGALHPWKGTGIGRADHDKAGSPARNLWDLGTLRLLVTPYGDDGEMQRFLMRASWRFLVYCTVSFHPLDLKGPLLAILEEKGVVGVLRFGRTARPVNRGFLLVKSGVTAS
jgi:hypothetical protein